LLSHEAAEDRLSHTYLLLFHDEVYLRFALKEFAKLFFDGRGNTNERIENGNYPDCLFYPEEGKALDKDGTNEIIDESCLSAVEGKRKLFVLAGMHKASAVVQNKLLKVLEEPPEGVHFLLGATSEFPLLTTVKSRAKKLEIPLFSADSVGACLGRMYPDKSKDELSMYAAASGGEVGRAVNLLGGGRYAELVEKVYRAVAASGGGIIEGARAFSTTTEKTDVLSLFTNMYRDMLFYKLGKGEYAGMKTLRGRLEPLSEKFDERTLVYALDVMAEAEEQITFNANLAQCVEVGLLKIEKEKRKCYK
jgi:DNA polymerase-3 subunit delta'